MINTKLQNYRNKSKGEMCSMIVERKKNGNLDEFMYGEDFDLGKDGNADHDSKDGDEEGETEGGGNSKKKKRLPKGAKPREITKDGSFYRLIMAYFTKSYALMSVSLAQICVQSRIWRIYRQHQMRKTKTTKTTSNDYGEVHEGRWVHDE
jgi:hypothetical protein